MHVGQINCIMSNEVVSFYDSNTDSVIEVLLSKEDAIRAKNGKLYLHIVNI